MDRHEAIFGTGQSPAEAPSPTLQPTEPSETSSECIESFPSPRDIVAHERWVEPLPTRKPLHKEALLRMHSRAKYLAALPKRGGLPPPTFEPRSQPRTSVEDMRIGLPPPPVKARPKSLQHRSYSTPVKPITSAVPKKERILTTMPKDLVGPKQRPTSRASEDLVTQKVHCLPGTKASPSQVAPNHTEPWRLQHLSTNNSTNCARTRSHHCGT